jgi:hypothetical protein
MAQIWYIVTIFEINSSLAANKKFACCKLNHAMQRRMLIHI